MNDYFQFKQFKIHQNKCAQKVTEIACIFGAACPIPQNTFSILDIGGGTGLLSLMLAQRSTAEIDCIEIDDETFFQLQDNIQNSIFKNRITPIFHDVNSFSFHKKYDLIICNPPFFSNSLKSQSAQKNKAWHDDTLSLSQLFFLTNHLLKDHALLHLLLPFDMITPQNLDKLHIQYRQAIKHQKESPPKFEIIGIGKSKSDILHKPDIIIRNENGYTEEMKNLLKDFYLYL